ncbi:uncharacterized protein K452DRAFT_360873 [Aplosporella prunicola CBS 121167]|uniref:Tubby C-terminal domain-containing protein n=1 Tax=Aplosporella prunicola CBS 121167 TaxID=1176127 RepID=A0A6A6B4U7_9PEZI|nr:uncharacterized protein K452DRAFT_360873 [Aplosporella prunicola CBS 121167]KAF2139172.1 hypothetical protein K452DRAFT_360873 [Aplosporella prunicola CBS 121167]
MPTPPLAFLSQPIAICPEHIAPAPTRLRIKYANGSGSKFTISQEPENGVFDAGSAVELFSVDGKALSRSQHRTFRSTATGLPLFELTRKMSASTPWVIELPGRKGGIPSVTLERKTSLFKDHLDAFVQSVDPAGMGGTNEVVLGIHGQDIWKLRTNVYLGDVVVASAKRTDKMAVYMPGKKLEWVVDVAAGMDMSLVSAIVVVLATTLYEMSAGGDAAVGVAGAVAAC